MNTSALTHAVSSLSSRQKLIALTIVAVLIIVIVVIVVNSKKKKSYINDEVDIPTQTELANEIRQNMLNDAKLELATAQKRADDATAALNTVNANAEAAIDAARLTRDPSEVSRVTIENAKLKAIAEKNNREAQDHLAKINEYYTTLLYNVTIKQ